MHASAGIDFLPIDRGRNLNESLADRMKPRTKHAVRELVEQAGIDVVDWEIDRNGRRLENPNENISTRALSGHSGEAASPSLFAFGTKRSIGASNRQRSLATPKRSKKISMLWEVLQRRLA